MRMNSASTLDGDAGEKQIVAVEELAGSWQGWVTRGEGQEHAAMYVSADGSYRSLTTGGASTEGKFYLQDGKLLCGSSNRAQRLRRAGAPVRGL